MSLENKVQPLKIIRDILGFRQAEMCQLLGMTRPTYIARERGRFEVGLSEIARLEEVGFERNFFFDVNSSPLKADVSIVAARENAQNKISELVASK